MYRYRYQGIVKCIGIDITVSLNVSVSIPGYRFISTRSRCWLSRSKVVSHPNDGRDQDATRRNMEKLFLCFFLVFKSGSDSTQLNSAFSLKWRKIESMTSVRERETERVREREILRERVCLCVCVCERERERVREKEFDRESVFLCVRKIEVNYIRCDHWTEKRVVFKRSLQALTYHL